MNNKSYLFRFDDVSVNTNMEKLTRMCSFLRHRFSGAQIMLAISPAVYDMSQFKEELDAERVFPPMLHTKSDFTVFYRVQKIGIPKEIQQWDWPERAAHGMAHVDHRLLSRGAQELSIVMSCSLVQTKFFVPPFHKYNQKTIDICVQHEIRLLTNEEDDWRHLKYHSFDPRQRHYYLHAHDLSYDAFISKFPPGTDKRKGR